MQRAPWASNGPNHLGLCTVAQNELDTTRQEGRATVLEEQTKGQVALATAEAMLRKVRGPTTWTILETDGPNHLGL